MMRWQPTSAMEDCAVEGYTLKMTSMHSHSDRRTAVGRRVLHSSRGIVWKYLQRTCPLLDCSR